jgi:tetrahydromethanopterin S-methyltransferase subunit B
MVDVDKTEELEQREARCADLESKIKESKKKLNSVASKNRIRNVSGKLYWFIGGAVAMSILGIGEYLQYTDFINIEQYRK